jgi:hypothetical protein
VIALPPVLVGATQVTAAVVAVTTDVTPVGAEGATDFEAMNAADGSDTNEVVALPLGVTVKVYAVPSVKPETVQCCDPVGAVVLLTTVQVKPPGAEVTVYVEATPSAVNVTKAAPSAAQAAVGVARKLTPGMIAADAAETVDEVPPPVGVTTKVYDVPFVRPLTVQLCAPVGGVVVFATVQLPPGVPATVYKVATPSATNETVIAPVPAFLTVGAASAAVGASATDAADTVELVLLPLGVTTKVYNVAFVRPLTVQLCGPVGAVVVLATTQLKPPGVETTVYVEATPSATNETVSFVPPAVATVGVANAAPGIAAAEAADTVETVPPPLGVTVNVYEVPFVSPVTVQV